MSHEGLQREAVLRGYFLGREWLLLCRSGINLTQFKLSMHQLGTFVEALNEGFKEWSELLGRLGFETLNAEAAEASRLGAELKSQIEKIISLASDAEASEGDDVTITPI